MEKDLFEPKGDRAEWRIVYDRLTSLEIDEMVTYQTLSRLLGRLFTQDRQPLYRAMQELERNDSRTLANVRGRGYRVVHPTEHEGLAKGHVRKSHRQLTKAKGRAASADRSALTPEARRRLDALEINLGQVREAVVKLNRKVSEHDEALEKVRAKAQADRRESQEDVASLSERVDTLADLLARHGIGRPATT
jgi:hypothetical protein